MNADSQEIRDRALAVLRDAGEPLTTGEISNRAGARREVHPCSDWHHRYDGVGDVRVAGCDGINDVMEVPFNAGQRGWRALAHLEKDGTVRGIRIRGQRAVMWVLAGGPTCSDVGARRWPSRGRDRPPRGHVRSTDPPAPG